MARNRYRSNQNPEDRETLFPCPPCGTRKERLIEYEDGTFWPETCAWCDGLGAIDSKTLAMFSRWKRILSYSKGNCTKPKRRPSK